MKVEVMLTLSLTLVLGTGWTPASVMKSRGFQNNQEFILKVMS